MGVRAPKSRQVAKRKPTSSSSSSWTGFFINVAARLSLYYAIYLYFWTCPKESNAESPLVCRGGDLLKNTIQPYVSPLYEEHLAPYVDKVSPYVKTANDNYLYPAGVYAAKQYDIYGKPRYEEAKVIVMKEYDRVVAPRVAMASAQGNIYYDQYLRSHVNTGKQLYDTVQPHVAKAASKGYEKAYPLYVASLPYAETAWAKFIEILGWASVEGKGWVERRWGMHVEPQLWRIQQKLGRKFAGDEARETPTATDSTPSVTSNPNDSNSSNESEVPTHLKPDVRAAIEEDLEAWSKKFIVGGEKAIADVEEKLDILCAEALLAHKPVTNDMLDALEDKIDQETKNLENELAAGVADADLAVKNAGISIRDESQKIRTYVQDVLRDLYDSTVSTVDAAIAVLESVHSLGMQELGMKWAWMDGVTYDDWARYNELKKNFQGAKQSVIRSGQTHTGLREVTDYANGVENEVNQIAENAVNKLAELKKAGSSAKSTGDSSASQSSSDRVAEEGESENPAAPEVEFADHQTPAEPVEDSSRIHDMGFEVDNHGHIIADDNHDEQGAPRHKHVHEESERLMEAVEQQVLQAEEEDLDKEKPRARSSIFAEAKEKSSNAKKVEEYSKSASKIMSENAASISSAFADATRAASEAIYGKTPATESVASVAKEKYDAAVAAASSILYGTPMPASESIASAISDRYSQAVSAASVAFYGKPTPAVESLAHAMGDASQEKFDAMKAFVAELVSGKEPAFTESVMSRLSTQWYGTQPAFISRATNAAGDAYNSAASVASDAAQALMTPPPAIESILVSASSQIANAVAAASEAIYGPEKGKVEKVTSAAADAASSASSVISEAIYGRQSSAAEAVQKQMYEAIVGARKQLSIAIMGTPQGKVESATSVLGETLVRATNYAGENAAVAQSVIAKNAAAAKEAVADKLSAVSKAVEENASAAASVAASLNSKAAGSVSTALYGKEKTYMESAQVRLEAAVESARAQLSTMFIGTELSFGERLSKTIEAAYSQATSAAGEAYSSASSGAGEALNSAASVASEAASSVSSVASQAASAVKPSKKPEGVAASVSSAASSVASQVKSKASKLKDEL